MAFRFLVALAVALALTSTRLPAAETGMVPVPDEELGGITGGAGIAFNLETRINALANGSADPCPTVGSATTCRIAIAFADRFGVWLAMKDYRGIFRLNNIYVDMKQLSSTWTTYTNNGALPNAYLNGFDPRNKPTIQFAAGRWATALATGATQLNSYMNSSAFNDMSAALNISRLSAEFDCGMTVNTPAGILVSGCGSGSPGWSVDRVPGYLRDAVTGSAVSLRYADGAIASTAPMQIRLDGRLNVFGY